MNKNMKIIIALAVAIVITLSVLIVALLKKPDGSGEQTTTPLYTLQPTTTPSYPNVTESWVDLNLIASNLASTTETSETGVTLSAPVVTNQNIIQNNTSVVYVDQFGNIIDINELIQNSGKPASTTVVDKTVIFDTTAKPTDNSANELSDFEITSNGVLTRYFGTSTSVIIPKKVHGKEVTGIGDSCFKGTAIERVTIPGHIRSIGNYAFAECKKLTSVTFLDRTINVTIGDFAFYGCDKLKKIDLPITKTIGASAFESCTALTSVDIKEGTESIGAHCFAFCSSLTKIVIRDTETVIPGINAFNGCNPNLRVQCYQGSDVEMSLRNLGISTAPITE